MSVHLFYWESRKHFDKAGYKPGKKTPSGEAKKYEEIPNAVRDF
jgi:hypothetical protein